MANSLAQATPKQAGARRSFGVFAQLLVEHVLSARDSVGGFPFRLAYHEVASRVRHARTRKTVKGAMRLDLHNPLLVEARTRLDALGDDPDLKAAFLRVGRLYGWFQKVRALMRLDGDFNDGEEPPPFTREGRGKVLARLGEIRGSAKQAGPVEAMAWEGFVDRFGQQEGELWAFLDEPGAARTTNQIESCHREDRRGVRKRTGQSATGPAMERVGEHLALWSNARNPWFIQHVLTGVDLVQEFLKQDAEHVKQRLAVLRGKRWRGRLPVAAKKRQGLLEVFVGLVESEAPEASLQEWADRVAGISAPGV